MNSFLTCPKFFIMEIPDIDSSIKRVVIVGAGFAGLTLAKKLSSCFFQVVLIDKNNYHQFQPLLYQVATAGLEPSSISFPLRKIFQHSTNVFIRVAEVKSVDSAYNRVNTTVGSIQYDYLVLANGADTNYFGMHDLQQHSFSMKSVSEALLLRNTLLQNYEKALTCSNEEERIALLNIVIVGGGPTGVELAGALAEMKASILPKDYPEINFGQMHVHLMEAAPRLLGGMSEGSGSKVSEYLANLGVHVHTGAAVQNYDGHTVQLKDGRVFFSRCVVWAAGIRAAVLKGIPESAIYQSRLLVNDFNRVSGMENVYAIGDNSIMPGSDRPKGHPQVAPVAMQQASLLALNLNRMMKGKEPLSFKYRNKGNMATVGRNLAVAELGRFKMKGIIAWFAWMMIHLMSIIGLKNRILILVNWIWQYITYDQSLRLIIRPSEKKSSSSFDEKFGKFRSRQYAQEI